MIDENEELYSDNMNTIELMNEDQSSLMIRDIEDAIPTESHQSNNFEENDDITSASDDHSFKGSLLGKKARTLDEIYEIYNKHANALGFSTKKGSGRTSKKTGIELYKYYFCTCEGTSRAKEINIDVPEPIEDGQIVLPSPVVQGEPPKKKMKKKQSYITRTNCQAQLRAKWNDKEQLYEVTKHVVEHNHEMTRLEWGYLKRSERSISEEKGRVIQLIDEAGIRVVDSYKLLAKAAGGEEYVGHTMKDHENFVQKLRIKRIEKGDANAVIQRLQERQRENGKFFYAMDFDDETRLKSLFWRDAMMLEDYNLYCDVIIFDTTYRTNKYNLICAPIVGVNNHWNTCMLGCAFLSSEKIEDFIWVLERFRESMGGKEPITIFTDQDQAMANAIHQVFQGRVRHRLCLWHIQQNAISRFGALKTDEKFKEAFRHCLMGCTDEYEFENAWKSMLQTYELTENSWFNRLYGLREKWCTALSKDIFSAGILSSQRSESTNHAICFKANAGTSLNGFLDIFTETVNRWRATEKDKEFQEQRRVPRLTIYAGLVKHAAEVYTADIFRFFEYEVKQSFASIYKLVHKSNEDHVIYEVTKEDKPDSWQTVLYYKTEKELVINCTCNHYKEVGWLCYHAIKILNIANVTRIPENYILPRWTKDAKKEVWAREIQGKTRSEPIADDSFSWAQLIVRKTYELTQSCIEDSEARKIVEEGFNLITSQVKQVLSSKRKITASTSETNSITNSKETAVSSTFVLDPLRANTKGSNKRPTSKFTRKKPISTDFGSKPRNEHLI